MRQPDFLKPGDRIGIVAPARRVAPQELAQAIEILQGWGWETVEGKHLYGSCNQFSGTDEERASDMQRMIDDPSVKAILCARGGYGCMRIIDRINFEKLRSNAKWIAGFSDITVFHSHLIKNFNLQTLHSVMAFNMMPERFDECAVESLGKALSGGKLSYYYDGSSYLQRNGTARGIVVGGNLSLLVALSGSSADLDTAGRILFIEDLDEYLYHVDRMMLQLKRSGKLSGLKGLIVGGMNDMKDNEIPFGKTAAQIIADAVEGYDYPVCFNFPAGHQKDNRALILGAEAKLTVGDTVTLEYI
jgi:muramoyltetrapeptide carboxypeptidase